MAILAMLQQGAFAVILPVGGNVSLNGTTLAARPELADHQIAEQDLPFSFINSTGALVSGTLDNRVFREDVSGTLDFIYSVTLDPNSGQVGAIRTSGFTGFSSDVDFRIDSLGTVDPASAQRFTGADAGDINFEFSPTAILGGQSSQFCFIKTTATDYNLSGLTDISADYGAGDQGFSSALATYAPTATTATPEPSGLLIWSLLLAICAIVAVRYGRWKPAS